MEALFHLVFTIVKLAILGSIYATLVTLLARGLARLKPGGWTDRISQQKRRFWFGAGALASFGLVVFSITHWGNHGLGDYARIPMHHGRSIGQIDGTFAYLEDVEHGHGSVGVSQFATTPDHVVGLTEDTPVDDFEPFFVWNLKTNELQLFESTAFAAYCVENDLPPPNTYASFNDHYANYWHSRRFWLLL